MKHPTQSNSGWPLQAVLRPVEVELQARKALVLALVELVGYRDTETGRHLFRLQRYCRCLAEEASGEGPYGRQITEQFIQTLVSCVPLHDIGKVGLPDYILLKPGKLTPDERVIMQEHTTIGSAVLKKVAEQYAFAQTFLKFASDIARHHHERYDGQGYPDRLSGEDIPLAARLVSIADVYDAIRSRRVYKPALSHGVAIQLMAENQSGQFDPLLMQAFSRCHRLFEEINQEFGD
jgi:response regulator RpfG family c-di-GMP phosphodiesterase